MSWQPEPALLEGVGMRFDPGSGRYRIVIPEHVNIAADTVGRYSAGPEAGRTALIHEDADGRLVAYSFRDLEASSTRLAAGLARLGVRRGTVVAVHSPQRPETLITHLAIYKLGAIAACMSRLCGPETVVHILEDSEARVLVTFDAIWDPLRARRAGCSSLEHVVVVGGADADEHRFEALLATEPGTLEPVSTRAEDPALLLYTSGSTGRPKGILHGHRILPALNASLELCFNLELRDPGLVFWTTADWAWMSGLNDVVYPSLAYGHTLMVSDRRFDSEDALAFLGRHRVTHCLFTPTALKRFVRVEDARSRFGLALRTVYTGGEPLPGEIYRLLTANLGVTCNEAYGQTEVNQMIGNCQRLRPVRPGSMGWAFPGHEVALVDEEGEEVADGEPGEIVVTPDNPTLCLGYWNRPDLTEGLRLCERWIRTHDLAVRDEEGYFWYRGRNDDLIKSAGFRIGPAEVEEALLTHPAVADTAVIGVPDRDGDRGQLVKAFVRLAAGHRGDDALTEALRARVKSLLGSYKQPRVVEYLDDLPTTSTGKVSRAALRRLEQDRGEARRDGP